MNNNKKIIANLQKKNIRKKSRATPLYQQTESTIYSETPSSPIVKDVKDVKDVNDVKDVKKRKKIPKPSITIHKRCLYCRVATLNLICQKCKTIKKFICRFCGKEHNLHHSPSSSICQICYSEKLKNIPEVRCNSCNFIKTLYAPLVFIRPLFCQIDESDIDPIDNTGQHIFYADKTFYPICIECHNKNNEFFCGVCQKWLHLYHPSEVTPNGEKIKTHSFFMATSQIQKINNNSDFSFLEYSSFTKNILDSQVIQEYYLRNNITKRVPDILTVCQQCTYLITLGSQIALSSLPFKDQISLGILDSYPKIQKHTDDMCVISYEIPNKGSHYILHGSGSEKHLFLLAWIKKILKNDCPYCTKPLNDITCIYIQT